MTTDMHLGDTRTGRPPVPEEAAVGELLKKAAAELGWCSARTATSYPSWCLAALDGSGRRLSAILRDGRLQICGIVPKGCPEVVAMPSIGVNPGRSHGAVAAEIRRRLLDDYDQAVRACREARARDDARRARIEAAAEQLVGIVTDSRPRPYTEHGIAISVYSPAGNAKVEVQDGTVCLRLDGVPTALAAAILTVLRDAASFRSAS